MNRVLIAAVAATAMFSAPVFAQSAKFAAVWTDGMNVVSSQDCASTEAAFCDQIEEITGSVGSLGATLAEIKVPQSKELLVGVSAQVELFTQTIVKGKKGSYSKATAMAGGGVLPIACNYDTHICYEGKPGFVVLDARQQELEAVLGGVIEECTFDVELGIDYGEEGPEDDVATGSATWTLDDCVVKQEEIGLAITTMSANHFNFVFPDLPQGDYAVVGIFMTDAQATAMAMCPDDATYCEDGDGDASAVSHAVIGKTMLTVQQVRAVKGSLGGMDFLVPVE